MSKETAKEDILKRKKDLYKNPNAGKIPGESAEGSREGMTREEVEAVRPQKGDSVTTLFYKAQTASKNRGGSVGMGDHHTHYTFNHYIKDLPQSFVRVRGHGLMVGHPKDPNIASLIKRASHDSAVRSMRLDKKSY